MAHRARPRLTYGLGDGVGEATGASEEEAAGLAAGEGRTGASLLEGAGAGLAAGTTARKGGTSLTTPVKTVALLSKLSLMVP